MKWHYISKRGYLVIAHAFESLYDIKLLNECDFEEANYGFARVLMCTVNDLQYRIVGKLDRSYMIVYNSSIKERDNFYSVKCYRNIESDNPDYKYIYGNILLFRVEYVDGCYQIMDLDDHDRNVVGLALDFQFYPYTIRSHLTLSDGIPEFKKPLLADDMKIKIGGYFYDQDISF